MILNIEPYVCASSGTKVEIAMPEFELGATSGYAYANVFSEDGRVIKVERVFIPSEIYAEWGTEDKFIANYVMEQLGLREIIEPVG